MLESKVQTMIAKIKNLVTLDLDEIGKEFDDVLSSLALMDKLNKELKVKYEDLDSRHTKLKNEYDKAIALFNAPVTEPVVAVTGELFDPAIHIHKTPRPISKEVREQILNAYTEVYKQVDDCKTLPEFFAYVQLNICSHASRTEIEGVIYNRFDLRLYK